MRRILLILTLAGVSVLGFRFFQQIALLQRKNSEGNVLGRVATIRSAMAVYYGDLEGQYPSDLNALVPKYLPRIEPAFRGVALTYYPHGMVNHVQYMSSDEYKSGKFTDEGGWAFVARGTTVNVNGIGTFFINCTHTDNRGRVWTSF